MIGRSPFTAAALAVVVCAALPATASAQRQVISIDQAAASVDFPVFEITRPPKRFVREFAVYDQSGTPGCPKRSMSVQSDYVRRPRGRPARLIHLSQSGRPCRSNDPAGRKVRRVRVLGRRVTVHLYCSGTARACPRRARDGVYMAQFSLRSGGRRTQLFFIADARVGPRAVLRALRSLRLVDLSRPVVSLSDFLSPDKKTFCQLNDRPGQHNTWCVRREPVSGFLDSDGSVGVCNMEPGGCIPGGDFGDGVPVIRSGQTSRVGRFACTELSLEVTCTIAEGEHAGTGFRIGAAGAVALSPAPPP
jgi:hypothetical protein